MRDLTIILDMSGSMSPQVSDTLGSINGLLTTQRSDPEECQFTLACFNHNVSTPFDHVPLAEVPLIDGTYYQPMGSTALYDAIGEILTKKREKLATSSPSVVRIAILTDGEDTCSRKFTCAQAHALIAEGEALGWDILFLGADLSTVATVASQLPPGTRVQAVAYNPNNTGQAIRSMNHYFSTGRLSEDADEEVEIP